MRSVLTYRFWATILLLLIYTFIATPVSFWHHHSDASQKESKHNSKTILAADCKICSHQYAPTMVLELDQLAAIDHTYASPKAVNVYIIPLAAVLAKSNKGPPCV